LNFELIGGRVLECEIGWVYLILLDLW